LDIEDISLTCPKCNTSICLECSVTYFGYAAGDREIPKCTNNECGYQFLYNDVKRESALLTAYLPCVAAFFLHTYQSEEVKETLEIDAMIEKVRKDKMVFLVQNLPPAVALTAKLCMGRRMATVGKLQKEKINRERKSASRPCMNSSCRGKLNSDYVCNLCESTFCKECERRIRGEHTCRQEDLDSIKEMKTSRACPNCSVPIFKYEGCMMMTCPVCKYHFHYETGEQISFGNNHNADVALKEDRKLFLLYEKELNDLGLLEEVKKIEELEVKPYSTSKLTKLVVKLHDDQENKEKLIKLAKELSSSTIGDKKYKKYTKAIVEIEDLIVNKELTPEKLSTIMEHFNDSS
jgi:uncharacterized Zn finger protein (UPF0148 family)